MTTTFFLEHKDSHLWIPKISSFGKLTNDPILAWAFETQGQAEEFIRFSPTIIPLFNGGSITQPNMMKSLVLGEGMTMEDFIVTEHELIEVN